MRNPDEGALFGAGDQAVVDTSGVLELHLAQDLRVQLLAVFDERGCHVFLLWRSFAPMQSRGNALRVN
jgi:hypothetical protein